MSTTQILGMMFGQEHSPIEELHTHTHTHYVIFPSFFGLYMIETHTQEKLSIWDLGFIFEGLVLGSEKGQFEVVKVRE